jgi:methylmalonyl-CoA/ethylmalonyl-CoA epimerase
MIETYKNAAPGDVLGDILQICLVTRNHKRTMDHLMGLGIGPWRIYKLDPGTTSDTRYQGEPHSFSAVMGYANSANMMWEIVEPIGGTSVFEDFLRQKGEGVHHFGVSKKGLSFSDAVAEFDQRGLSVVQSGRVWGGQVGFAFIGAYDELGHYIEIWDHPAGFTPPDPDSWYPAPPAERGAS